MTPHHRNGEPLSVLSSPLDGGLISRAPKGPFGRAPKGPYQSSLLTHPYQSSPLKGPYQSSPVGPLPFGRAPPDPPEAEAESVAGYNAEYARDAILRSSLLAEANVPGSGGLILTETRDGVAHSFIWVRVFPNLQIFIDPAREEEEEAVSDSFLRKTNPKIENPSICIINRVR